MANLVDKITTQQVEKLYNMALMLGGSVPVSVANKIVKAPWGSISESNQIHIEDLQHLKDDIMQPDQPNSLKRLLMKANQYVRSN